MASITRFIEEDLKLKINKDKSKVDRPWKLKYLGFTFYPKKGEMGIRAHQNYVKKPKTLDEWLRRRIRLANGTLNIIFTHNSLNTFSINI